mgnify:CR=1 FL=1
MLSRRFAFLALGLIAIAGCLGYLFQYSTSQTLALAEALEFRRMQVAAQPDGTYRFFFVTNRVETGPQVAQVVQVALNDKFSTERRSELTFGHFDTAIEPALGIGMLINPTDWFQNEEIQLRRTDTLPLEIFLKDLRGQVDASPERSLMININGFRERFPSA